MTARQIAIVALTVAVLLVAGGVAPTVPTAHAAAGSRRLNQPHDEVVSLTK